MIFKAYGSFKISDCLKEMEREVLQLWIKYIHLLCHTGIQHSLTQNGKLLHVRFEVLRLQSSGIWRRVYSGRNEPTFQSILPPQHQSTHFLTFPTRRSHWPKPGSSHCLFLWSFLALRIRNVSRSYYIHFDPQDEGNTFLRNAGIRVQDKQRTYDNIDVLLRNHNCCVCM